MASTVTASRQSKGTGTGKLASAVWRELWRDAIRLEHRIQQAEETAGGWVPDIEGTIAGPDDVQGHMINLQLYLSGVASAAERAEVRQT
jgi:hypothetical protein